MEKTTTQIRRHGPSDTRVWFLEHRVIYPTVLPVIVVCALRFFLPEARENILLKLKRHIALSDLVSTIVSQYNSTQRGLTSSSELPISRLIACRGLCAVGGVLRPLLRGSTQSNGFPAATGCPARAIAIHSYGKSTCPGSAPPRQLLPMQTASGSCAWPWACQRSKARRRGGAPALPAGCDPAPRTPPWRSRSAASTGARQSAQRR